MFRTLATFLTTISDTLDDMLVGDAEIEAAEYAQWYQARECSHDSNWRQLWDASAQDREMRAASLAKLGTPLSGWSADVSWLDGPDFAGDTRTSDSLDTRTSESLDARESESTDVVGERIRRRIARHADADLGGCPAQGRWRAAVMNFEEPVRRSGAVAPPSLICDDAA